jgi:hypothetical protein
MMITETNDESKSKNLLLSALIFIMTIEIEIDSFCVWQ